MTETTTKQPTSPVNGLPQGITIRNVTSDQSGKWLEAGWRDFKRTPAIGLAYGGLCVVAGYLILLSLFQSGQPYLTLPLGAGFMLLAPVIAVGLYETSRRLEMGENVTLWHSLNGFRRNPGQLGAIGVVLMLFFLAWTRIAMLLFALFYNGSMPSLVAVIVFAITVVSIPLLVDRDIDVITALIISVAAFRKNWRVLTGWAAMIAVMAACGMVVFLLGLAIMMPLLGYSSWHAYRGLIDTENAEARRLRRAVP